MSLLKSHRSRKAQPLVEEVFLARETSFSCRLWLAYAARRAPGAQTPCLATDGPLRDTEQRGDRTLRLAGLDEAGSRARRSASGHLGPPHADAASLGRGEPRMAGGIAARAVGRPPTELERDFYRVSFPQLAHACSGSGRRSAIANDRAVRQWVGRLRELLFADSPELGRRALRALLSGRRMRVYADPERLFRVDGDLLVAPQTRSARRLAPSASTVW